MDSSLLLYETRDRVAYLTINRPDQMNALNQELFGALGDAIERIRDDDDILAGVITGAGGRAFSAGADLKEMSAGDAAGRRRRPGFNDFTKLGNWKPLIAAIDGYCVAAGLELAMQCDIRVATAKSAFGLPEPRWSLLAGYGLHYLSRMVPMGEALYMQLTGDRIDAQRALRIGLIQEVVADRESLDAAVGRLTDSIKMCAPLALQAIKQVVYRGRYIPPEYAEQISAPLALLVNASEDAKEGPKAFAEKRKPAWKGR